MGPVVSIYQLSAYRGNLIYADLNMEPFNFTSVFDIILLHAKCYVFFLLPRAPRKASAASLKTQQNFFQSI